MQQQPQLKSDQEEITLAHLLDEQSTEEMVEPLVLDEDSSDDRPLESAEEYLSRQERLRELLKIKLLFLQVYLATILKAGINVLEAVKGENAREELLEQQLLDMPKKKIGGEHEFIRRHGFRTVMDLDQFRDVCASTDPSLDIKIYSAREAEIRILDLRKNIKIKADGDLLKINNKEEVEKIDHNVVSIIADNKKVQGLILAREMDSEFAYHIYAVDSYLIVGLHNPENFAPIKYDMGYRNMRDEDIANFFKNTFLPDVEYVYAANSFIERGVLEITSDLTSFPYDTIRITPNKNWPSMFPPEIEFSDEIKARIQDAGYIMYKKFNSIILKKEDENAFDRAIRISGGNFSWINIAPATAWPLWLPSEDTEYIIPPESNNNQLEA